MLECYSFLDIQKKKYIPLIKNYSSVSKTKDYNLSNF
jgi:hypothetical protein